MIQKILLPLERTDADCAAIDCARSFSRHRGAEMLLIRIEEWPFLGPFGGGWIPSWRSADLDQIRDALAEPQQRAPRILYREAMSSLSILPEAYRRNVSLIIVGYPRDRSWISRIGGTLADRLFHDSIIPVLAVPENTARPIRIRRILYIHDESDFGIQGSRHLIECAQLFEAQTYLLERSFQGRHRSRLFSRQAPTAKRSDDDRSGESSEDPQSRLFSILRKREVPATIVPREGDGPGPVVTAVTRYQSDLVILSRCRETLSACSLLALQVMESTHIPVLATFEAPGSISGVESRPRVRIGI